MRRLFAWLPLVAAVVFVQPASAHLREGFELFGLVRYTTDDETAFDNPDPFDSEDRPFEVEPSFSGGGGFGYNWNGFINTNVQLAGGPAEYRYLNEGVQVDGSMVTFDVNVEVNLIDGPVTPYVAAGVGLAIFDGEDEDAEVDAHEAAPAGNLGGGLRVDFGDHVFVKGFYRFTVTELEDSDEPLMFHSAGVAVGWQF